MQVSLITCTFNSEKTIKDCCLSILSQSYQNIEHIILDKNSQDQTLNNLEQFKTENQKIIQQKSSGIYGALNEGMNLAKGDIIGILHSDDEFMNKDVIKDISNIFLNNKIDLLFSNLVYTKKNNTEKIIRKWESQLNEGIQSSDLITYKIKNGWMPPHPTIFIRKNLLKEINLNYDESYKISSDYDFILKLFNNSKSKIFYLNKFTIKMRFGGTSNKSIKNIIIKMMEDFKILKKHKLNSLKIIFLKNFSKIKQFF